MSCLDKLLALNRIIITDGSFGSQLNLYVDKSFDDDPLWSSRALYTNPEAVIQVHMDYIKAGVDIIQTNSYQASEKGFMKYLNLSKEESYNLIKKSVELAKVAVERCQEDNLLKCRHCPLIAGSVGPYAAFLHDGSEYNGLYTDFISEKELEEFHRPRLAALVEAGVDLLAIETIPSRKEAEVLIKMIQDYKNIRAWLSFNCRTDGVSTAYGDNYVETAKACFEKNPQQLIAVGVNCIRPSAVEPLLLKINDNLGKPIPLIVYTNSGEQFEPTKGWNQELEPLEQYIPKWLDLGVKYIGGCCRVCVDDISRIKKSVHEWQNEKNI